MGLDLYVSERKNKRPHGPDRWNPPTNLGPVVNSASNDIGPGYFDGGKRGTDILYFTSNRLGGPGLLDIYASTRDRCPTGVRSACQCWFPELSSASNDARPVIRADGLEAVLQSDRLPSEGQGDVWTSTRTNALAAVGCAGEPGPGDQHDVPGPAGGPLG